MRKVSVLQPITIMDGCNLPYLIAQRYSRITRSHFEQTKLKKRLKRLEFHFVKTDNKLYFYSNFHNVMLLLEALSRNDEIQVGHYSTHKISEADIELLSWHALFEFIERHRYEFEHVAAYNEIKANIPKSVCREIFEQDQITQQLYCDLVCISMPTFNRKRKQVIQGHIDSQDDTKTLKITASSLRKVMNDAD